MTAADEIGPGVRPKTPKHLWIVGILALLWNFMGAFDYLATQLKLEDLTPRSWTPRICDVRAPERHAVQVPCIEAGRSRRWHEEDADTRRN